MDFEYGIIGGGPAGYTTALALAKKGHTVVLFEKDKIGGTCLNRGCIPTKSLLHSSELYYQTKKFEEIGIDIEIKSFDFSKILEKRDKTIEKIRKSLELTLKNSNINIVYEEAKILNPTTILADKEYNVSKIILANGSKPKELKNMKFDGNFILSSDDLLNLKNLPKSALIIGSGAIGIEWARIFSNFGTEVTIIEKAEHLAPLADIEVSKRLERIFKQRGINYFINDYIESFDKKNVKLSSGKELTPEIILLAIGREPITSTLTDCVTIGDATGELQLAHYAIHQGLNFVENNTTEVKKDFVPSVIYGEPEIAWFGLREQDCTGENYSKVTLPITAIGKSWCDDATDGFIKIITKDNKIKGAHVVSKEASALIHQILIAAQNDITIDDFRKTCFAHPTFSEGIFEAICRL